MYCTILYVSMLVHKYNVKSHRINSECVISHHINIDLSTIVHKLIYIDIYTYEFY